MRILIVHNRYRLKGGEESVVESESELLSAKGHTVKVLFRDSSEIERFTLPQKMRLVSDIAWSSKSFDMMRNTVREFRADIVHAHNIHPLWSPSIFSAAHESGAATVMTLHNYRLVCQNGLLMRNGRTCSECLDHGHWRGVVHRCVGGSLCGSLAMSRMMWINDRNGTWRNDVDAFISLTNDAKEIFSRGGVPADRIYVKPNCVADPLTGDAVVVTRLGALFIGHLLAFKGIEMLLDAWQQIEYPLCVVGEGPLLDKLRLQARKNITFVGRLPYSEVLKLLSSSSFVLFPSHAREGFPRVIVEAFAMGRAVIASRHGAMKEIVRHNETGLLYDQGNVDDLRRQAALLAGNPTLALSLGQAARREYLHKYTADSNYRQLIDVYHSALDRSRRGMGVSVT